MVDGVIQNAEPPFVRRQSSDPLELLDEPSAPLLPRPPLSDLDVLALSAADISSSSWDSYVRKKAKEIYDYTMWIRGLFGALDGLIISYSTFKYIFDFITPANTASADAMHDWMLTGSGAFGACTGSLAIITLSLVGNIFDDNHKNPLLRSMVAIWPYVRDGFKGLKFAYKGVRSTIQVAQLMGVDLRAMIFPLGLVLGVAAAANRIWYRSQVTEKRKDQQKSNNVLLKRAQYLGMDDRYTLYDGAGIADDDLQLQSLYLQLNPKEGFLEYKVIDPAGQLVQGKLSLDNDVAFNGFNSQGERVPLTLEVLKTHYREKILAATCNNGHTATANTDKIREEIGKAIKDGSCLPDRGVVVASALFGGFIDGLYTYMGAMGLAILSPQLFGAIAVCCLVFTVICVINRYYEEDQYQNEFLRSKLNVELVLAAKEIEDLFAQSQRLSKQSEQCYTQAMSDRGKGLTASPAMNAWQHISQEATRLEQCLKQECEVFETIKKNYDDLSEVSTGRAILMGLRTGLYCYSAVSSIILAYAAFCTTFPPALLVTAVAIGIVSLIAFAVHAVIVNNEHREKVSNVNKTRNREQKLASYVDDIKEKIMTGKYIMPATPDEQDALMDGMPMGPMSQIDYQPALEIIRSCCSGLPKGNKGLDFAGEYWLEPDSQGHYQEAPWMGPLGAAFSLFYAIVYALRAFGKGYRGANDVPVAKLYYRTSFEDVSGASSPTNTPINFDFGGSQSPEPSQVKTLCTSTEQTTDRSLSENFLQLPSSLSVDDVTHSSPSPYGGWPRFFGTMGDNSSAGDLLAGSGLHPTGSPG